MDSFILNQHKKLKHKIIGLWSGNSFNSFALAVLEICGSGLRTRFQIIHTRHQAYSPQQKKFLSQIRNNRQRKLRLIGQVKLYLARIWAEAINEKLIPAPGLDEAVDLIGLLGPAVHAQLPGVTSSGSQKNPALQLGDPAMLAWLTGITTIGDFCAADLAAGGRGRPLLPYLDWLYFSPYKKNMLVVNIGDLTACTYIPADGDKLKVRAADAGPGNGLLDQLMQRLYELPFDRDGGKAGLGAYSEKLFDYLQDAEALPAPVLFESDSRDRYGSGFILAMLRRALRWRIPEPDVIHTVSRYIAFRAWKTCQEIIPGDVQEVLLAGSGSHNLVIRQFCTEYFRPLPVKQISTYNLTEDFREACGAAVLAHACMQRDPANFPVLTGANQPVILGKIFPANKNPVMD